MSSGITPEGEVFRDKTKSKWVQKKMSEPCPHPHPREGWYLLEVPALCDALII